MTLTYKMSFSGESSSACSFLRVNPSKFNSNKGALVPRGHWGSGKGEFVWLFSAGFEGKGLSNKLFFWQNKSKGDTALAILQSRDGAI